MLVTFDPEDGSPVRTWTFDPDDLLRSEATAIEKAYGEAQEMWINSLRIKNAKARTVLLWHLLKEDHPNLKFVDTPDFRMRQMKVEMSSAELKEVYDQIGRTKMDDDIREAFEAAFQRDYQDALTREGKAVEGELIATQKAPVPKAD